MSTAAAGLDDFAKTVDDMDHPNDALVLDNDPSTGNLRRARCYFGDVWRSQAQTGARPLAASVSRIVCRETPAP